MRPGPALRALRTALAVLGAVTLLVVATPLTSWMAHRMAGHFDSPNGDVLVLLTGSPATDGVLSGSDHIRCVYAVRAWKGGRFRSVLISGTSAGAMRDFLVTQGIPAAVVSVDENSRSTRESALHTAPLLRGAGAIVLLTSDYHIFRARRAFERAGTRVLPRPVPDAFKRSMEWPMRWTVFAEETTEAVKIAGYWAKRWL